MSTRTIAAVFLALIVPTLANAEGALCYEVSQRQINCVPQSPILINRRTGESWILVYVQVQAGASAWRWFPLTREKQEFIFSTPAPSK
jgi:hypothetical protein